MMIQPSPPPIETTILVTPNTLPLYLWGCGIGESRRGIPLISGVPGVAPGSLL